MKKIILLTIMAMLFTGCGGDTTTTNETVSINCGDGGCGDLVIGDNNEIHKGEESQASDTASIDFDMDNFDKSLSKKVCNDFGFFFCTAANACQPTPLKSGTCPNK